MEVAGRTTERFDRVCGQIGVRLRACMSGAITGPPAESEYAVEPVGVDTINPSDRYPQTYSPLENASRCSNLATTPFATTTSFKAK